MSWAIRIENVGKTFRRGERGPISRNFRESLQRQAGKWIRAVNPASWVHSRNEEERMFWALREVSAEIAEGEIVAIIGPNGAGKSTLLKILSRITPPAAGVIRYRGRLASLLEVGTGFHRELTGRENIYLNGSILGMTRREITGKLDEIVEFSGVGKFLDTPVKFYSSGMYVRLAFAVAAHLETDILLVDEVLAVGDAEFQKRCTRRMSDVAKDGRTVLLVSHNMGVVQTNCARGILLREGRIVHDGPVQDVVRDYLASLSPVGAGLDISEAHPRAGSGAFRVRGVRFSDAKGDLAQLVCGQAGRIRLEIEAKESALPIRDANIALTLYTMDGFRLCNLWSRASGGSFRIDRTCVICEVELPRVPFRAGEYRLEIFADGGGEVCDWIENAGSMEIAEGDFYGTGITTHSDQGPFFCEHRWRTIS
ncbi:MAG: ABC transporter ATP-binding protein [Verrucomicrobiae bacterium]|nr:ABC transporter ATP-binding protein [Verrucomicrobiae bacterium]